MEQSKQRQLKPEKFTRSMQFERETVNEEKRTVELAFSSETEEVTRWFGKEILDHGIGSMRMERLQNKAPLLDNHGKQIGVIEKVEIGADRVGRALVRFSKRAHAEEIFQDVIDAIITHSSVGYVSHKRVLEKEENNISTFRVTDWEPYEISMVGIPADITVGVGREFEIENDSEEENLNQEKRDMPEKKVTDETETVVIDADAIRNKAIEEVQIRTNEMLAIGAEYNSRDLASKFIKENKSVDGLRAAIMEGMKVKSVNVDERNSDGLLGMSDKEIEQYSVVKAIRTLAAGKSLDGIELEASQATATLRGKEADEKAFLLPHDMLASKRALNTTTASAGGYTVGTEVLGDSMIDILRNKSVVESMGVMKLSGVVGDITIPKQNGAATTAWLAAGESSPFSDQTFGQIALTPKRLTGVTAIDNQLLKQSSIDVESFVRNDIMAGMALAKDLAAIDGVGGNQPLGILRQSGINTVTFGGVPTWAKVVDFETQVAIDNAEMGSLGYITTPSVRGSWKTTPKVAAQATYIWNDSNQQGRGLVNGYRAEATNQVPGNKVIYGNFNDLMIVDWAGVEILVNPFSLSLSGQISILITLYSDMAIRNAVSFAISTDSGSQT